MPCEYGVSSSQIQCILKGAMSPIGRICGSKNQRLESGVMMLPSLPVTQEIYVSHSSNSGFCSSFQVGMPPPGHIIARVPLNYKLWLWGLWDHCAKRLKDRKSSHHIGRVIDPDIISFMLHRGTERKMLASGDSLWYLLLPPGSTLTVKPLPRKDKLRSHQSHST